MKEGYVEQSKRKKILLLSDDLRYFSGVGTVSKEIVFGTSHRYNWVQIGAAAKHPEQGKIINLSEEVNLETGLTDANVKIIPNNGYGDAHLLRKIMNQENPDAIFIFTDPRYWTWLFSMEREIRAKVPIIYLNIWDDLPYPLWNRNYYLSCDALLAISKQTYNINKQVLGEEASNKVIRYIPHGVSSKFYPIPETDPQLVEFKKKFWSNNTEPTFKLLYNARNLGRKRVADLILAWNEFCKRIGEEKALKCELLLHTALVDNAGTDLGAIYQGLCEPYVRVRSLDVTCSTEDLNILYNICDGVILPSSNEGWGLSLTEALRTGKMIIATVTGGMQDQMRFEDEKGNWIDFTKDFPSNHTGLIKKHGEWAIPVFPTTQTITGSPSTPFVFDDRCKIQDIADAIEKLYNIPSEERRRKGMVGFQWSSSEEAGFTANQMNERIIEAIEATFTHFKSHPRSRYDLSKLGEYKPFRVNYDILNYKIDGDGK